MFDDKNDFRWTTLVAGLILLIVLAAVAAMPAGSSAATKTEVGRQDSANCARHIRTVFQMSLDMVRRDACSDRVHELCVQIDQVG